MILYPFLALLLFGGASLFFQLRAARGDHEAGQAFGWLAFLAFLCMLAGIVWAFVMLWLPVVTP